MTRILPLAILVLLTGCGSADRESPVEPASTSEAQALNDAATMLDDGANNAAAAPANASSATPTNASR